MNDSLISGTKIGCSSQVRQKIQTKTLAETRKFWSRNISVDFAKIPAGVHSCAGHSRESEQLAELFSKSSKKDVVGSNLTDWQP